MHHNGRYRALAPEDIAMLEAMPPPSRTAAANLATVKIGLSEKAPIYGS